MELGIRDRVAIVCGASKGMGRAIAAGLAAEGARVLMVARGEDALQRAAAEIAGQAGGDRVLAMAGDLGEADTPARLVAQAVARWGRLDIVVTNTGGPKPGQPSSFSDDDWLLAYQQIFFSAVRLAREALPHMRAQNWGRIVNLLALSVVQVEDNLTLSSTARKAVAAFAKSLSDEVARDGITVNNVLPGSVLTERLEEVSRMQAQHHGTDPDKAMDVRLARIPAGRFGQPEEMADLVCFLASERAGFLTGLNIPVDGGQLRAMP